MDASLHAVPAGHANVSCRNPFISRATRWTAALAAAVLFATPCVFAATTNDPFQEPIKAEEGVIVVDVVEFASLPDTDGNAPRMMRLIDEPGTGRLFVNGMRGPIHSISYDGKTVTEYIDINDPEWGVDVQSGGRERGFQSFAFHPEFGRAGEPGFGKFYTWTDTRDNESTPDFRPGGGDNTHHTVLLEWTAETPGAATYDGGPPRELARFEQPFGNHNAGHLTFNRFASPDDPDYGLLYVGVADGGSGGDPLGLAQDLTSPFGKLLRIDPLGSDSENGEYGIPSDNPFVGDEETGALGEIYAYGLRNPQRFDWDPETGRMYLADIGQNVVETVSPVPPGGNLGWNEWEGSYRYSGRSGVSLDDPRSDPDITYPFAEYDRRDPLMSPRVAVTGVPVYRSDKIPQLRNRVLFADFPSGEIFHFDADNPPEGGNQGFRRILLRDGGEPRTEDLPRDYPGQERGAGKATGQSDRPPIRIRPRRPDFPFEQTRRHRSPPRARRRKLSGPVRPANRVP